MNRIIRVEGTPRLGRTLLAASLAVGLLAAAFLVLGTTALTRQQREPSTSVAHTLEVLGAATTLDADLATASGEGRAFVIAGTAESRARFDAATLKTQSDLVALGAGAGPGGAGKPGQIAFSGRHEP